MRVRNGGLALAILGQAVVLTAVARGENWPQFRGPDSGLTANSHLPTEWGPDENVAWKVKLPGAAWSQPVVWGDRIFVTTAVTENQAKPSVGQPRGGRGGFGRGPGGPDARGPRDEGSPGTDDQRPQRRQRSAPADSDNTDRADSPRPSRDADDAERPADGEQSRNRYGRGPGAPGGRGGFGRSAAPPDQVYRWMVLCLDRSTGDVLWQQVAHEGKPTLATHRSNTYASETPIVDGQRVYAYFGMTGLYCYDLDGKPLWSKNLGSYPMSHGWGTGSSPALASDRLFVQCDNDEDSFLVALDSRTGDELWRVARDEKSNWSTPYVWTNAKRTELVTAGGEKMCAYDPATGKLLWSLTGVKGRCSATPVGSDELLYVGVGGGMGGAGPLVAIRAGAAGDLTLGGDDAASTAGIAWSVPRAGPPMASPLVYDGNVYVLEQRGGIIGCYDAATGEQRYRKRIEGAAGFASSPWAADGKIFCLDETGQTFVLARGPELNVLATNKLPDQFWSSVAVAGDHLLLRGVEYLYSIGPK